MSVQPHQQRVIDEKAELDEKLTKLVAFFGNPLWATLPIAEQERLSRQSEVMRQYSNILEERIAAFPVA